MPQVDPQIEAGWKSVLLDDFNTPQFLALREFLKGEKERGVTIYPPGPRIFAAFDSTPWEAVRVVILGQDPYHGPGQANGLSFSVAPGIRKPPSLVNIFKEIQADLDLAEPTSGDLTPWARQGVLMLNAMLSVQAHQAGSHRGKGWETFTDAVIRHLSERKQHLVFLLWGRFAQSKAELIDSDKHHILKAAHPSPLSAHNGFFGCRHFSQTNAWLQQQGYQPIDWQIP